MYTTYDIVLYFISFRVWGVFEERLRLTVIFLASMQKIPLAKLALQCMQAVSADKHDRWRCGDACSICILSDSAIEARCFSVRHEVQMEYWDAFTYGFQSLAEGRSFRTMTEEDHTSGRLTGPPYSSGLTPTEIHRTKEY